MGVTTRLDRVVLHGPGSGRLERAAHRAGAATPEELMYAEVEVAGCGVMNHRRHSELTAAATLVLLLSVLLLLLQPTHLGNAPALLSRSIPGFCSVWFTLQFLFCTKPKRHNFPDRHSGPRSSTVLHLSFPSSFSATFVA
jgi:hypothetical protein